MYNKFETQRMGAAALTKAAILTKARDFGTAMIKAKAQRKKRPDEAKYTADMNLLARCLPR